jgi:hypothetical protein
MVEQEDYLNKEIIDESKDNFLQIVNSYWSKAEIEEAIYSFIVGDLPRFIGTVFEFHEGL